MTPRTVLILCDRTPEPVPAVRYGSGVWARWECSYCGRRVQVVA